MTKDTTSRKAVVISLGTGARRTARWIHKMAVEYDVTPEFSFVSIETTSLDESGVPDEFLTIPLETDARVKKRFEQAKADEAVSYLNDEHELLVQGATRDPPVGRFLLEYHSRRVYEMITEQIRSAVTEADSELSVWILGTLSGGTGAGMFPLLSAMVHRIASDIGDDLNIDVYFNGLATVSELSENRRTAPGGVADYYVNTNNSLRAMATLLALPDAHGRPRNNGPDSIEMLVAPGLGEANGLLQSDFDIASPRLDALFLMPINEDNAEDADWEGDERTSYLARVNYTLASTVIGLSTTSGDNDLGNLYNKVLTDRLYTLDAASVRTSVKPALQLIDTENEIFAVRGQIDQLESNLEGMRELANDLETLRSATFESGVVPDVVSDISSPLAGRSSQLIEGVSSVAITDVEFDEVETHISRVLSEVPDREVGTDPFEDDQQANSIDVFEPDGFIPHAAVGRYTFLKMVLARVDAALEDHPFENRVEDLWEKNEAELEDEFAGLAGSDAPTRYEQALDPFLSNHESDIEDQIAATSIVSVRKQSRLSRQLSSIQATRNELKDLFEEYERLTSLQERIASAELPALGSELQETMDLVDTGIETASNLLEAKQNRLQNLEQTRQSYHDRVVNMTAGRITEIPLNIDSTKNLSRETFESATDLFDLVDAGLIDNDSILRGINRAVGLLKEPMEDYFHEMADNQPSRLLIPMTAPGNKAVFTLDGTAQPNMGAITANNDVTTQLNVGTIDTPFQLDFVMLHGNIRLANTSEFRLFTERWETGQIDTLLGKDVDVRQHRAYPELVPSNSLLDDEPFVGHEDDADDEEEVVA